jgi:flagellar M-ring protein FliF
VLLFAVRPIIKAFTRDKRAEMEDGEGEDGTDPDQPRRNKTMAMVSYEGGGDRDRLAAQLELAQRIVREKPDDALLALRRMLGDRRKETEAVR